MRCSILSIVATTLLILSPAIAQSTTAAPTSTTDSSTSTRTSQCNTPGCGDQQAKAMAPATPIPMGVAAIAGMGVLGAAAML